MELKVGSRLGRDFLLSDLRAQGFRAVFLAPGAQRSRDLEIEGADLDGVLKGVDFLLNVNMGYRVELGRRVLVVGGGNVAVDVARSALRTPLRDEAINPGLNIVTALDVARSAIRFGAKEVHIVCLESLEAMPADRDEIHEALREGIVVHAARGPQRILGEAGRVTGLETIECSAVFDAQRRFNPTFVPGTELAIAADTVVLAIGQACDLSFLRPDDHVEVTRRGTLQVDPETLATTAPGIYAGGDAAFGPRVAINAIADGKKAAASIHGYLRGTKTQGPPVEVFIEPLPGYRRVFDYEGVPRQLPGASDRTADRHRRDRALLHGVVRRREGSRAIHCWSAPCSRIRARHRVHSVQGLRRRCVNTASVRAISGIVADPSLQDDLRERRGRRGAAGDQAAQERR